jgi:hypothetical protein
MSLNLPGRSELVYRFLCYREIASSQRTVGRSCDRGNGGQDDSLYDLHDFRRSTVVGDVEYEGEMCEALMVCNASSRSCLTMAHLTIRFRLP